MSFLEVSSVLYLFEQVITLPRFLVSLTYLDRNSVLHSLPSAILLVSSIILNSFFSQLFLELENLWVMLEPHLYLFHSHPPKTLRCQEDNAKPASCVQCCGSIRARPPLPLSGVTVITPSVSRPPFSYLMLPTNCSQAVHVMKYPLLFLKCPVNFLFSLAVFLEISCNTRF